MRSLSNRKSNANINSNENLLNEFMHAHNAEQDIEMERLIQAHIAGLPEEEWVCQWESRSKHGNAQKDEYGNIAPLL